MSTNIIYLPYKNGLHPLQQLARQFAVPTGIILFRLAKGWTVEEALTTSYTTKLDEAIRRHGVWKIGIRDKLDFIIDNWPAIQRIELGFVEHCHFMSAFGDTRTYRGVRIKRDISNPPSSFMLFGPPYHKFGKRVLQHFSLDTVSLLIKFWKERKDDQ